MSKSKVRPGGPDSCLFVRSKGDEELGQGMWAFVSISGETDGEDLKYRLAVFLVLTRGSVERSFSVQCCLNSTLSKSLTFSR